MPVARDNFTEYLLRQEKPLALGPRKVQAPFRMVECRGIMHLTWNLYAYRLHYGYQYIGWIHWRMIRYAQGFDISYDFFNGSLAAH